LLKEGAPGLRIRNGPSCSLKKKWGHPHKIYCGDVAHMASELFQWILRVALTVSFQTVIERANGATSFPEKRIFWVMLTEYGDFRLIPTITIKISVSVV